MLLIKDYTDTIAKFLENKEKINLFLSNKTMFNNWDLDLEKKRFYHKKIQEEVIYTFLWKCYKKNKDLYEAYSELYDADVFHKDISEFSRQYSVLWFILNRQGYSIDTMLKRQSAEKFCDAMCEFVEYGEVNLIPEFLKKMMLESLLPVKLS